MQTIGIVAEYNPFHTGHAFQIAQSRKQLGTETAVVAVMSGNWVQQADCAIADKWVRARLALLGGADLVLELPTVWATASAEAFARGAVAILAGCGVVDALSFGSECGDVEALTRVAHCLGSPVYAAGLRRFLDEGMTFAACRQAVVEGLLGKELGGLLRSPNNNLGVEYIRALGDLGTAITPMTVRREGAGHGEHAAVLTAQPLSPAQRDRLFRERHPFLSATEIRCRLMDGEGALITPYLPQGGLELLEQGLPLPARVERAMLARLRAMGPGDWAALPDSGAAEGLPGRLDRAGGQATSMEEFFQLAKTKRYTHARLKRLVLWAWLGITAADIPAAPPYLRVLGFNVQGREILKAMKSRAALPILTKPAHAGSLDQAGRRLFELEARCTDLYDLCFETIPAPGREWVTGPVML